ncbi:lysine-specific demethylase REF6 [Prunus yedoensis var. nudiflora]|uniref:Lysine-specific demethylase REF6 n=1 Tax=Prunus yedoensis var. nudiflora TaxID=2094558 RepID=A0A315B5X4_PRUYE|nr:lysine-specific demethylase REF6 [Prunus yedoensis var. nudiflora]
MNGLVGTSMDPMKLSHSCSADAHGPQTTELSKVTLPIESTNTAFPPGCDEDSSRMHVFCLEHAIEVNSSFVQLEVYIYFSFVIQTTRG